MAVSNQKLVVINKTTPPNKNYFKLSQDLYFLANSRLTQAGMTVYMFFMTLVPDTWDGKVNKENTRQCMYELSTSYIAEITYKDTKTAQRGINDLIDKGYLISLGGNQYQFIDILPEDKVQTIEEHEQVMDYQKALQSGMSLLNDTRQKQLQRIAEEEYPWR